MRLLLGCLPLILVASGCDRSAPGAPSAKEGEKTGPAKVRLVHPAVRTIEYPARVTAFYETPIHARVAGFVTAVDLADIDDNVKGPVNGAKPPDPDDKEESAEYAGQVLARLAVPELEQEVELKRRLVAQADAEVIQAEEAYKAAVARVAEVKAGTDRVEADLKRWEAQLKGLDSGMTVGKQELDEVRFQVEASRAAKVEQAAKVTAAEAAQKKYEADIGAAKAKRDAAKADRARSIAMLRYSVIRAPFDGVVSRRLASPGTYREPGAGPLFVITRMDKVRVLVEVPETGIALIRRGANVSVRVPSLKDKEFLGTVTRTSWALDARSRALEVAVDLDNRDGLLRTEMYALARIEVSPRVLTLPAAAVVVQGDEAFAFKVVDGKAVRTPVKVGRTADGLMDVKDVNEKDEFVAENAAALADGAKVVVEGK
jgi:RND family efflux transporter MFP subunit